MSVGPYPHLVSVGTDGNTDGVPSWVWPNLHDRMAEWARVAWRREGLRTAFNMLTGEVEFYRTDGTGYPIIFTYLRLDQKDKPGELSQIEQALRVVRLNRRPWEAKSREEDQAKKSERDRDMENWHQHLADERPDLLGWLKYRDEHRGMHKNYRPSIVKDAELPPAKAV